MTDFRELLRRLVEADVEFILVGGVAAIVHGSSRLTEDLDVVYRRTDGNIARLVDALIPLEPYLRGAPPGLPFHWDCETISRGLNFSLTTNVGPIDLLAEITGGGTFDDLLPNCVRIAVHEQSCLCLNLTTLIRVKRAVGRPKDFESIAELEALLEEKGDG